MSTQVGPKYPSNGASEGKTNQWINPGNIIAEDSAVTFGAASKDDSAFLVATGFDFSSIPDNAQIVGIKIEINGQWVFFL